ncbi:site-2 protease family protein [Isoptericola sp. b408]|uniref:site-2 protease family protein n=1 Tax=Isoptericola sp. b408 TaxID=3064653 RepID=UPI002712969E|nr:site-2 protease family protein [Isoptericola sp. b408]MDO8151426.1 site-2 protease family protein [Isoptericola sp. b408]
MTQRSSGWRIGRVAGAPVLVTRSWFVAAVVLTLLFAPTVRAFAPAMGTVGVLVVAFAFVLLLFASVFCHEVAHALVARARGHRVDELALTLWGGHTAYSGAVRRPRDSALIAVVGPLTNLALAAAFWFLFTAQSSSSIPALLLYAGAFSNAFVGAFNLLPGLPLDGGQVLESAVWALTGSRTTGTVAAGWVGRAVGLAVVLGALVWPLVGGRSPDLFTVMWAALIGAFLWSGASEAMRAGRRRDAVSRIDVRTLMTTAVVVPAGSPVAEAGRAARGHGEVAVVVVDDRGEPTGWVDPQAAAAVPADQAAAVPVESALVPFPAGAAVALEQSGPELLEHLARVSGGARVVPVTDGGRVVAVLDVARVAAAVRPAGRR